MNMFKDTDGFIRNVVFLSFFSRYIFQGVVIEPYRVLGLDLNFGFSTNRVRGRGQLRPSDWTTGWKL